jgi:hypothetical protein
LRRRIQQEILALEEINLDRRQELRNLEDRERQLAIALTSVEDLKSAKTLIGELVEKESKKTLRDVEELAKVLATSLTEETALVAALGELDALETTAGDLRAREDALVGATVASSDHRADVVRLRAERDVLARAIASKLLTSNVIRDLRFGGFSFFAPQSEVIVGALSKFSEGRSVLRARIGSAASASGISGRAISYAGWGVRAAVEGRPFDPSVWLPALLPWPPPDSSSRVVLERRFLGQGGTPLATLGQLDDWLQKALSGAGYAGSSYWGVPAGFAIVTPLEQTNAAGVPLAGTLRWAASIAEMKSWSLAEYFKALLTAPPGYFRVLMLVTSTEPFAPSSARAELESIERWSRKGLNVLPDPVRAAAFTDRYRVTVLVYEFTKQRDVDKPETTIPGRLLATDHLKATHLAYLLGEI